MGTDTAKPSPERRRFAEGMTDIVSSAPGISNVLSGERLAAAMEAEDLPAAGAAAVGMIPGASGYVGKQALNVARNRLGNRAVEDALRLADGGRAYRKGYATGGDTLDQSNPYLDQVRTLYQNIFNRKPDEAGENYWANKFASSPMTLEDIQNQFTSSDEAKNRFGDIVRQAYQESLGRNADEGGLNYWTDMLRSGKASLGDVEAELSTSQEAKLNKLYKFCHIIRNFFFYY
jgi:hypothetical protein